MVGLAVHSRVSQKPDIQEGGTATIPEVTTLIRLLRTQSLEWYYNNIKSQFKRFGSSKVLKMLYRKHCAERGALSDIGGSHDESVDNAESTCGSDSTFYRQSEGHSMAETLTVALRVAEEAIEEAISKAEEYRGSLEKQNEAHYLHDNKEKLIEELATTIVQKIIRRRKNSEMQPDSEMEWPLSRNSGQTSPTISEHSTVTSQTSHKGSHILWARMLDRDKALLLDAPIAPGHTFGPVVHKMLQRSHRMRESTKELVHLLPKRPPPVAPYTPAASKTGTAGSPAVRGGCNRFPPPGTERSQSAFSLTGDKPPEQPMDSNWKSTISEAIWSRQEGYPSLKNDPKTFSLPSWRSMDRLDNSTPSSVLQSPDGNWIALQSTFQPRPSLVTKPKSQVFTALERESATISAYDDLGSDTEDEYDSNELRRQPRRLSGETYYTDSQYDPAWTYTRHRPVNTPSSGQYTDIETMFSDSETSSVHSVRDSLLQICKQQVLKRKGPDHGEILDINFNPQAYGLGTVDSSEAEEPNKDSVRRSRRRRKSKPLSREHAHDRPSYQAQSTAAYQIYDDSLGAGAVNGGFLPQREADALEMKLKSNISELTANVSDNESSSGEEREQEDIRLTQVPLESSCYEERQSIQEDTRKLSFLCSVIGGHCRTITCAYTCRQARRAPCEKAAQPASQPDFAHWLISREKGRKEEVEVRTLVFQIDLPKTKVFID
ncbi:UNVERIFIED_CONTAM: hypothetical protein FKN15_075155 [Acipenser sinensis]